MVLVWQIKEDLPNSPNFLPAKLFHYMVATLGISTVIDYNMDKILFLHGFGNLLFVSSNM